jgi:hypothetical protein
MNLFSVNVGRCQNVNSISSLISFIASERFRYIHSLDNSVGFTFNISGRRVGFCVGI